MSNCSGDQISTLKTHIIKNYLYKLFLTPNNLDSFQVNKALGVGRAGHIGSICESSKYSYDERKDQYYFDDDFILYFVNYYNMEYLISIKSWFEVKPSGFECKTNNIFISGYSKEAARTFDLFQEINKKAIEGFSFRWKILKYHYREPFPFLDNISIIEPVLVSMDSIYLPNDKINQIKRFIATVSNYNDQRISLRYLFNGNPGTGKTLIMNSIITSLKEKATVFICNGANIEMDQVFEFCGYFEPCILVIDDIDFVTGNRDSNKSDTDKLAYWLQALDGFIPNNVFILAATNDKKLVDEAAKRPGRFDLILDIGEIEADNYMSLIERETDDASIIELFDRQVLNKLEDKKVSGAFIVNLVKQLKTIRTSGEDMNSEIFTDMFNLLYKGFYEYNDSAFVKSMGFNN